MDRNRGVFVVDLFFPCVGIVYWNECMDRRWDDGLYFELEGSVSLDDCSIPKRGDELVGN